MVKFHCPVCQENLYTLCSPALDLTLGRAVTCTKCGAELAALLLVMKKEKLINYLKRRENG